MRKKIPVYAMRLLENVSRRCNIIFFLFLFSDTKNCMCSKSFRKGSAGVRETFLHQSSHAYQKQVFSCSGRFTKSFFIKLYKEAHHNTDKVPVLKLESRSAT